MKIIPLGTHRFQRAIGERLIESKLRTYQWRAGSDAYPGSSRWENLRLKVRLRRRAGRNGWCPWKSKNQPRRNEERTRKIFVLFVSSWLIFWF